ncbi:MAG: cysteine desulfurase [Oscillospiraceae bacterium]|nr:cysteine desulfurase [Oscillospiraceae bacterium]
MLIYFDNAATTRVCPEAAEAALRVMREEYGNPSSSHALGRQARDILEEAREKTAAALGGKREEVFFTSGGTEADNLALFGGFELMCHRGKHIITSETEHDAVLNAAKRLAALGADVTFLKPDGKTGAVPADAVREALRDDTVLVSLMLVNNETGARNPVEEVARLLKTSGSRALLHVEAVQAFCNTAFSVKTLMADIVSVSGHTIHAPKGSGALWVKTGVKPKPVFFGGGQEKGLRSGTEALPGIAAFGEAARIGKERLPQAEAHLRELHDYTLTRLREAIPDVILIADGEPAILPLSLPGYRSEVLLNFLDAEGVCVSKSSACKRGGRSHVLEAMGLPARVIDGAVRVSFSRENTTEEAESFVRLLAAAAARLAHN